MKITKETIDDVNAILKIEVEEKDYKEKVNNILKDYRKKADVPGFRKGKVPMSYIKKQYEKPVILDEVNTIIQDAINNYLTENKIEILGNPLPKYNENFSWDNPVLNFDFEIGLTPDFEINLQPEKPVTHYKIIADDKTIDKEIENIKKQFGKTKQEEVINEESTVTATFANKEENINKESTFEMQRVKGKAHKKALLGKKVGDTVTLNTKDFFDDDHYMQHILGVPHEKAHGLETDVDVTINKITGVEKAELNKELFDKLFKEDDIKSIEEFRAKIAEIFEKNMSVYSNQKLLDDVTGYLVENTKINLPSEFLKKWIIASSENPVTPEQAEKQYNESENSLKYQLIESKLVKDNNLNVTFDELKDFLKQNVKAQMAQYGVLNPDENEVEKIALSLLENKDKIKDYQNQVFSNKLLDFYKNNVNLKEKKVTFDEFSKK